MSSSGYHEYIEGCSVHRGGYHECNPCTVSLSRVVFHMGSEKHAVSSHLLKLPCISALTALV